MAIVETPCPHCHRQAQFHLVSRVAEGPYPHQDGQRTQWGRAFVSDRILKARTAQSDYETQRDRLAKQMLAPNITNADQVRLMGEYNALPIPAAEPYLTAFAAHCGFADCGGPVLMICSIPAHANSQLMPGSDVWEYAQITAGPESIFEMVRIFPESSVLQSHPSWPLTAQKQLPEIAEDLARGRDPARILSGARTILDIILRDLLTGEVPAGRKAQITALQEQGIITTSIANWARDLWKEGSDATHDGIGDRQTAEKYVDFLKVLLHVAYVLPSGLGRDNN